MPVYKMLEMPYEELMGWFDYFGKRPPGWEEDNRAYMLLRAQGVKEPPEAMFNSLRQLKIQEEQRVITHDVALKNAPSFLALLNSAAERNGVDWRLE